MEDDDEISYADDGALQVGHNIGDNLATRAILSALIAQLASERTDGAAFVFSIYQGASQALMRVVEPDTPLHRHTDTLIENFFNATETRHEALLVQVQETLTAAGFTSGG